MENLKAGPPPDNSVLIFAGAADIDNEYLRELLDQWLPEDLELRPPVIQKTIPRAAKGLKKVLAWLEEQFPPSDDMPDPIDRPDDLPAFITSLRDTASTFLVLLWGNGDDEKTEALADAASRHGITLLDLNDGLDEIQLADNPPETPEPPRDQVRRRGSRRAAAAHDDAAASTTEPETPPFSTDEGSAQVTALGSATAPVPTPDTDIYLLAAVMADAHRAYADVLARFALGPSDPHGPNAIDKPETTRTWLQDPANQDKYVLRGRGRIRAAMKNWTEVQLTPTQERELGLTV